MLVATYNYDVGNYLFEFISYLLKYLLTSLQMKQNNTENLKECLTLNKQKNTRMSFSKNEPTFLTWFTSWSSFQWTPIHWKNVPKCYNMKLMGGFYNDFLDTKIFTMINL